MIRRGRAGCSDITMLFGMSCQVGVGIIVGQRGRELHRINELWECSTWW